MNERTLHAAESWVWDKVNSESFQLHDDWYSWEFESKPYDINIFTDFSTGKTGATIYPLRRTNVMNIHETDTLKGVRIL